MSNFNFYINVDQCLNMSNFEMFFYKLQSEHKFHLSNVQFFEDEGEQSLKKAFYEIRNYIDKSSFFVRDYRLIFGMRENRKKSALQHKEITSHYMGKKAGLYRLIMLLTLAGLRTKMAESPFFSGFYNTLKTLIYKIK